MTWLATKIHWFYTVEGIRFGLYVVFILIGVILVLSAVLGRKKGKRSLGERSKQEDKRKVRFPW